MSIFIVLVFFLYVVFVILLIVGWRKAEKNSKVKFPDEGIFMSIIIAARNEEARIGQLLQDIINQSYKNFEVIVVDDHSTDKTSKVVDQYRGYGNIRLISNHGEGKKLAITTGVKFCKGEIIVTTDADCRVGEAWLATIISYFDNEATKMVFGSVKIRARTFFSILQAHEFLSLVGTAAGTLAWGYPSMCNGANLAFRKSIFKEIGGYADNLHIPSGDDEFLMLKIAKRYRNGIRFVAHADASVETYPCKTLSQFIYQRIRWAGKSRYNLSLRNIALAVFIFCFQSSVLALVTGVFFGWFNLLTVIFLLLSKAVVEWIFLKNIACFLSVRWSVLAFAALQVMYPLYAFLIGIFSIAGSFEWKGRKLKSVAAGDAENKSLEYNDL